MVAKCPRQRFTLLDGSLSLPVITRWEQAHSLQAISQSCLLSDGVSDSAPWNKQRATTHQKYKMRDSLQVTQCSPLTAHGPEAISSPGLVLLRRSFPKAEVIGKEGKSYSKQGISGGLNRKKVGNKPFSLWSVRNMGDAAETLSELV